MLPNPYSSAKRLDTKCKTRLPTKLLNILHNNIGTLCKRKGTCKIREDKGKYTEAPGVPTREAKDSWAQHVWVDVVGLGEHRLAPERGCGEEGGRRILRDRPHFTDWLLLTGLLFSWAWSYGDRQRLWFNKLRQIQEVQRKKGKHPHSATPKIPHTKHILSLQITCSTCTHSNL